MEFPIAKNIWGDTMCLYWPWAMKKAESNVTFSRGMDAKPCLSVMHAKAHSWSCQVHSFMQIFFSYYIAKILWGGRWQEGAAYGSGEDMEQLFSNLSRLNATTKYMCASGY